MQLKKVSFGVDWSVLRDGQTVWETEWFDNEEEMWASIGTNGASHGVTSFRLSDGTVFVDCALVNEQLTDKYGQGVIIDGTPIHSDREARLKADAIAFEVYRRI